MTELTNEERQKERIKSEVNIKCVSRINQQARQKAEFERGKHGFYVYPGSITNCVKRSTTSVLSNMGLRLSFVKYKNRKNKIWVEVSPIGNKSWEDVHESLNL